MSLASWGMIFSGSASAPSMPQRLTPSAPMAMQRPQGRAQAVWNQLVRRGHGEDIKHPLISLLKHIFILMKLPQGLWGSVRRRRCPNTRRFRCARGAAAPRASTGRRAGSFREEKRHHRWKGRWAQVSCEREADLTDHCSHLLQADTSAFGHQGPRKQSCRFKLSRR